MDSNHVGVFSLSLHLILIAFPIVAAEDIAEEIAWAASRPPHVNIAQSLVFPVNQASATISYREPKKQ